MRDEKTSQLIYDVIEQSGGMEAVKREVNRGGQTAPFSFFCTGFTSIVQIWLAAAPLKTTTANKVLLIKCKKWCKSAFVSQYTLGYIEIR